MFSTRIRLLLSVILLVILTTPVTASSNPSIIENGKDEFIPSALDINQMLPDPEMDAAPEVQIRGTSGEFGYTHYPSAGGSDSYTELTWTHTAGTTLDWYTGDDYELPDCEDFIYLTQEFAWNSNEIPDSVFLNFSINVEMTGDFDSTDGDLMFGAYAWLIDSSGNWQQVYRSFPSYSDEFSEQQASVTYFDRQNVWGGMIEDEYGNQEDLQDVLTFAFGLSPTSYFQSYSGGYTGAVRVKIEQAHLYTFMAIDPDSEDVLEPLVNDTWGRKVTDIFPDAPEEYENATDMCLGLATGDDSSVYVLAASSVSYDFIIETRQRFVYQTLLKYDSEMNLIWVRNQRNMSLGLDIIFKNGFIYTAGYLMTEANDDILVTKWDVDGNIIWDFVLDTGYDERAGAIGATDDGSVYVFTDRDNWYSPNPSFIQDSAILKLSSSGVLEWNITIDMPYLAHWMQLEVASNGFYTYGGDRIVFRDFDGVQQWNSSGYSFTVDSVGNLYSQIHYYTDTGRGIQFNKTNESGELQWTTNFTISQSGWDEVLYCPSMSVASDGSLIAYLGNLHISIDHYLAKFSPDGEYQWHKYIGDENWVAPYGYYGYVSVAPNGIAYVAITLNYQDVGVYSYDVGVWAFIIPLELLLLLAAGLVVIAVAYIIVQKRPKNDDYKEYKTRYDL